jgi:DNA gyrase/topoisomerase IV subunit B
MRIKSNGGTMVVCRATIRLFGSEQALRNMIDKYRVTYDSEDLMFVFQRELDNKPDMESRMHESGLHYYDPRKEQHLTFINNVSKKKQGSTKKQIKGTDTTRTLYKTFSYPSMKDFKWVIRSNQIKDCPVTVQYINVALNIWGKNIASLKGKTTWTKSIPVARD